MYSIVHNKNSFIHIKREEKRLFKAANNRNINRNSVRTKKNKSNKNSKKHKRKKKKKQLYKNFKLKKPRKLLIK